MKARPRPVTLSILVKLGLRIFEILSVQKGQNYNSNNVEVLINSIQARVLVNKLEDKMEL